MALKATNLKAGDVYSGRVVEDLKRTQIVQYAGASGDYNPNHTDEIFATKVSGYPSVFAHGMLTMGMTGKVLADYVGDGRLTKYSARFANQVWPGDDLDAKIMVKTIREANGKYYVDLKVETINQNGIVVMYGNATALIDA